jgi:TRAP-type mannitol/chloroaromatic compound transport system permease small subunit
VTALLSICRTIEAVNSVIGRGVAWLALFMVVVTFAVVLSLSEPARLVLRALWLKWFPFT